MCVGMGVGMLLFLGDEGLFRELQQGEGRLIRRPHAQAIALLAVSSRPSWGVWQRQLWCWRWW